MHLYRCPWVTLFSLFLLLQGCATIQPPVLDDAFWAQRGKKIVINVRPLPKPGAMMLGSQGLVDVAINKGVSSTLDAYVARMVFEPYQDLGDDFAKQLSQRGFATEQASVELSTLPVLVKGPDRRKNVNYYKSDLSSATAFKGRDYALLIWVDALGTARSYYGFIPMSAPQGYVQAQACLVDLANNEIRWSTKLEIMKGAALPWDQPPSYPNITQAVDAAIEQSKHSLMTEFFGSHTKVLGAVY